MSTVPSPLSAMAPASRRQPNFTEDEESYLIQQYEMYKSILSVRGGGGGKSEIWTKIANGLNVKNPSVVRTGEQIKAKWYNMVAEAFEEYEKFRQQQQQQPASASAAVAAPSANTFKILELANKIPSAHTDGDGNTSDLAAVDEGESGGGGEDSSNIDIELKKANLRRINLESEKLEVEIDYLTKKMDREFR